jgi:thiamine pyrophosphokinase
MAQRAIVLSNGEINELATVRQRVRDWGEVLVIAADNGVRFAGPLGLFPDIILGDMDSLDPDLRALFDKEPVTIIRVPAEKDETDLELALLEAANRGAEQIAVVGAIGGRLDMTLSNVLLLTHPDLLAVRVELWAAAQTLWVIRPPGGDVFGETGDTLSLIPIGGDARGLTTENLKYPLDNETLAFGPARGISNVLTAEQARVDLDGGLLLAVHTPGRA